ncbi:peptidoglycan-binding domain-containing protein [Streptomyces sp. ALI-76-A]|jgi:hypothetical protein|uniref:peptidoglycan-binding domain-containing protein n=1 Tax=Streptomyces sp. ALI-76-A TaxID=3025736 RepID=UPI00256ED523|nr:peptidoglycan-binding domain-containing protein [Streptomyces sp. ALI-76-A]MDL5198909.1 peptidoglycan-binding domain-containing protein [Streptomyces sp. ALI-76-A]
MSARTKRVQLAAGIVGVLTVATLTLSTSPASASGTYSGRAYIYGAGNWVGDWGDEGILSTSTNASSNATCLWQKILWADLATETNGTPFDAADIDGHFGANTKAATKDWQARYDLEADGSVGKETWAEAGTNLEDHYDPGDTAVDTYRGIWDNLNLTRDSDGRYHFEDGDDNARIAGYDYLTCT